MSNPAFGLTDAELSGLGRDELLRQYQNLRGHHQAAIRAHDKRDRSAILRMAGNIAAGLAPTPPISDRARDSQAEIARTSVAIARHILAEVDK